MWSAALPNPDWMQLHTWWLAGTLFILVTALHFAFLLIVLNRWTVKPVLIALFAITGLVTFYMNRYTVFFDTGMMRNVLHTDIKEARELLSFALLFHMLLISGIPILFISRLRVQITPWPRAPLIRGAFFLGALAVALGCVLLAFQDLSALMRNHREVRYLVTPGNYLVSFVRALAIDPALSGGPRATIGKDAALEASWSARKKPILLVIVVGETARAANWGLSGYARQTTPELSQLDVLNFSHVTSCGTNTEVSVPCMFSPYGRHGYDEKKIRQHESLLHVLDRVGINTLWRDNQSGCKGVCEGLPTQRLDNSVDPALCDGERCLDEILLQSLDKQVGTGKNMVLVLHQLGNHGPAYYRRYPGTFRRYAPTCDTAELGSCSREQIINSYDNAILYTDYFLASTIRYLQTQRTHDAAMIYVSDHGESLGENGIFLHGMPYSIAPKEQTEVPMMMWFSPGFTSSLGIRVDCLKQRASQALSHDYLFHSVLGLLRVKTKDYDQSFDFSAGCRNAL
jgi:lipid A ethanolaminephosphotransferase